MIAQTGFFLLYKTSEKNSNFTLNTHRDKINTNNSICEFTMTQYKTKEFLKHHKRFLNDKFQNEQSYTVEISDNIETILQSVERYINTVNRSFIF